MVVKLRENVNRFGMRVAIVTEGGKNIGFGHITRCLSLYEEFKRRKIPIIFVVNEDAVLKEKLKGKPCRTYQAGTSKIKEIIKAIEGFDALVIDSYLLALGDYLEIRSVIPWLICIDDNQRLDYPADVIVNGAVYAQELNYPKVADRKYLLGPSFIPIRPEFAKAPRRRIKDEIENILITFGGNDPLKRMPKIRSFLKTRYPSIAVDVLHNKNVRAVIQLMRQADIAISAGGQTLYELACTGAPTVGICVADNQINNLEGWEQKGFLKYCGWYDEPDVCQRLQGALAAMRDKKLREKMSRIGQKFVDGRGAERTVAKILEMIP